MATVTGLTAERMQEIIDSTIVDADVIGDNLILTKDDGSTIDAGNVRGPAGADGAPGSGGSGSGIAKVSAFPTVPAPADGDVVVRIDLPGDPMFKFSDGAWEQQPRMGAQTVPSARIQLTSDKPNSVPTTTFRPIGFDAASHDTNGMFSSGTPSRLTIKTPGLYLIQGSITWDNSINSGERRSLLRLNGSGDGFNGTILDDQMIIGQADDSGNSVSSVARLAAGDYVELVGLHNAGSNIGTKGTERTHLSATWLGGAGQTIDERGVPAVRLYKTAHQAVGIAAGATSVVTFDAEDYDTDSMHDLTANQNRITIKTPGLYQINATLEWDNTLNGIPGALIYKNGAPTDVQASGADQPAFAQFQQVSGVLNLAAGDFIELWGTNNGTVTCQPLGRTGGAVGSTLAATLVASGKTVAPFAKAYMSAAFSVPDNVWTTVPLDGERSDNDNIHDTVTNNTRLTCRTAGVYLITGAVHITNNGSGNRQLRIMKNGGAGPPTNGVLDMNTTNPVTGDHTKIDIATVAELAVGDYVELQVFQNSTISLALNNTANNDLNHFEMVKIGSSNTGNTNIEAVEGITPLTLINGWANPPTGRRAPGVYKDRGRVWLSGFMDGTSATGTAAFVLPAGYRPATTMDPMPYLGFNSLGNASMVGEMTIDTAGNVTFFTNGGGSAAGHQNTRYTQLEGISFRL